MARNVIGDVTGKIALGLYVDPQQAKSSLEFLTTETVRSLNKVKEQVARLRAAAKQPGMTYRKAFPEFFEKGFQHPNTVAETVLNMMRRITADTGGGGLTGKPLMGMFSSVKDFIRPSQGSIWGTLGKSAKDFKDVGQAIIGVVPGATNVLSSFGKAIAGISVAGGIAAAGIAAIVYLLKAYNDSLKTHQDLLRAQILFGKDERERFAIQDKAEYIAHKYNLTMQETINTMKALTKFQENFDINLSNYAEDVAKFSVILGQSGESIANIIGMISTGSGSARGLVTLGIGGTEAKQILKLSKSGSRELAIVKLFEQMEKSATNEEMEFLTRKTFTEQITTLLSDLDYSIGDAIKRNPVTRWINEGFKKIRSYTLGISPEEEEAAKKKYQVWSEDNARSWQQAAKVVRGEMAQLLQMGAISKELFDDIETGFTRMANRSQESLMSQEQFVDILEDRKKAEEVALKLYEGQNKELRDKGRNILIALKWAQAERETLDKTQKSITEVVNQRRILADLHGEVIGSVTGKAEDILRIGLFGSQLFEMEQLYKRITEDTKAADIVKYGWLLMSDVEDKFAQGKLSGEEYYRQKEIANILVQQSDNIAKQLNLYREKNKELEEAKRKEEEAKKAEEDRIKYLEGLKERYKTNKDYLEDIIDITKDFDEAVKRGIMAPGEAAEKQRMALADILGRIIQIQKIGIIPTAASRLLKGQSGTQSEIWKIMDEMRKPGKEQLERQMFDSIKQQLEIGDKQVDLLKAIEEAIKELIRKQPGAGR